LKLILRLKREKLKLNPIKDIFFSKKVTKFVGRVQGEFGLIKEGDKVLVGLSGGKDSFVLLHVLKRHSV